MLTLRSFSGAPARHGGYSKAGAVASLALVAVIVPQIVARAMSFTERSSGAQIALAVGLVTSFAVVVFARWLGRLVPRRSSHQLADRHLGTAAGLLVSAARMLSYALAVILGVELAVRGLDAIFVIPWNAWLDPALILVTALPTLLGRSWPASRWLMASAALAGVALAMILGYALIQESMGAIDVESIRLARREAYETERVTVESRPLWEAALGGALLGAFGTQISERIMAPEQRRHTSARTLGFALGITLAAIAITLYFVGALRMPGQREAVPLLSMSYAFFGVVGQNIVAVVLVSLGLAVAALSYAQLPRLLRELALDGLLPRRFAAADSRGPRRVIVAVIAILAAGVTIMLDSTRSISAAFVLTMYVVVTVTAAAMVSRARATLRVSVSSDERSTARKTIWLSAFYGVAGLIVVGAVAVARPEWALAGVIALSVPSAVLVGYSRGYDRRAALLKLDSTHAGRDVPARVHGVVLIDRVDEATLQALTWARALRLSTLTAITVDMDGEHTRHIRANWAAARVPVELTILGEPRGPVRGPVVAYVRALRRDNPGDLIHVIVPRVIQAGAWDWFFLSHTTPRVVTDLRREPNVLIAEAPYHLAEPSDLDDSNPLFSGEREAKSTRKDHHES